VSDSIGLGDPSMPPQWRWDGSHWVPQGSATADHTDGAERGAPTRLADRPSGEVTVLSSVDDDPSIDPDRQRIRNDQPRRVRSLNRTDRVELVMAATAGISLTMVLAVVMDWRHPLTLILWGLGSTLVVQYLLVRDRLGPTMAVDRVVSALVWAGALVAVGVLGWMLVFLLNKGLPKLSGEFLTKDRSHTGPLDPGGGAWHAIVGTLEQTIIATVAAVPIGILTAVYLHEMKGRMAGTVRFFADAMSGLPSIVAGLLVYALWVQNHGYSGISASAALVVVMLPIVTRTAEEVLRTVPGSLREASFAIGAPQWRTVTKVVLPTARSGLVTAAILSIARVVGETAPLILTAFGSASLNKNPLHDPQQALPLYVYQLIKEPNASQNSLAWTGALVLVLIVLVLFVIARVVSARGARRLGGSR
jgi:phosphate transport system permease protein